MNEYEAKVRDFHAATGSAVDAPFSAELLAFRDRLLAEELAELQAEIARGIDEIAQKGGVTRETKANLMKEMADVQYVLSGMAVTFGLPIDEVFGRVHESNLSKFGADGKPVFRADGKILKGPDYHPPKLDDLV
ncbi:MAG: hypothetical protein KGL10_03815 [Alphaproteobacteria bacterium]|nr:hypothetical protein [Alphaproteobacteria bacterium]MDE2336416.1 hypothetical protein [Alphaproteobacteria bacterium]